MWQAPPQGATLVLGGARSGKSRFAESLVEVANGPLHYLATAQAQDEEMRARIAAHRARRGPRWTTHEEPVALAAALDNLDSADSVVLVDCLTLWLSNLMLAGRDPAGEGEALAARLRSFRGRIVLVSNEVGLGLVPDTPLGRDFRDAAGSLNQTVAAAAQTVVFVAAGLPLCLKPAQGLSR